MKNFTFLLTSSIFVLGILYATNTFSQTTIDNENFNTGLGIWNDPGSDMKRENNKPPNSSWAIRLRDNSSTSWMTSDNIDISTYSSVNITFDYQTYSMENGEDFWVRYSDDGGNSWTTIATYVSGTNFSNGIKYIPTISIDSDTYSFSTNSQFRIQCDASDNSDKVYIDNVLIEGFTTNVGNISNLIDFDGLDDHIDFGNNHNYTDDLTIEAWILQENTVTKGTIVSKNNAKTGNENGYSLEINNNYLRFIWYKSSGNNIADITSPYPIANNKWYHIAATINNNSVQLYIDGVQVKDDNTTSNPTTNSNKFMIGATYHSDTPTIPKNYFDGYIDEVRVWDVSLSPIQIREMMNQEIEQNEPFVKGKVVPLDVSGGLLWEDLKGYYTMTNNSAIDRSSSSINGSPMNSTTEQLQNAPLPYTTKSDGTWSDTTAATPWLYGDTNWNTPNNTSVDGSTRIDWNIVKTSHNIASGNKDITVLALITDASNKKLVVANPNETLDENNSGQGLRITHYLKIDGDIDLVGKSQLIQDLGSILDVNSSGKLQIDQQGTADLYTYNFWSSPVGLSNTTTNNNSYTLIDVFRDGTSSESPLIINFLTSGYNGSLGNPISIADYWVWKYSNNLSGSYASWQHVRSTGTLLAAEGFTLKGVTNTSGDISQKQNYVFEGKPNNGDITLTIDAGNEYLIGNPYPSALDAHQFLIDNRAHNSGNGVITGPLYFWNHWGNGSHALSDYQGGYATYSMSGGAPAPSSSNNPNSNKSPGRYIPVGQGFFVSSQTGSTIKFNNGQRVFVRENDESSMFIRSNNSEENLIDEDIRPKIRIGFNSVNTIHRQLLFTLDPSTTPEFDWGYDALVYEFQIDDMFWLLNNEKYVILSTNEIAHETIIPLGILTNKDGLNSITIDELKNVPSEIKIFVHDKELNIYHDLRSNDYEFFLAAGEYLERFEIVFNNTSPPDVTDETDETDDFEELTEFNVHFSNASKSIIIINPTLKNIKSVELFNTLGQSIYSLKNIPNTNYSEFKTNNISSGTYILKLNTETRTFVKKILID